VNGLDRGLDFERCCPSILRLTSEVFGLVQWRSSGIASRSRQVFFDWLGTGMFFYGELSVQSDSYEVRYSLKLLASRYCGNGDDYLRGPHAR
jgi:hypothetical protein